MGKDDKDLRKEIEELEKLIEIVKEQHKEEKKQQKQSNRPPSGAIRIDLGAKYSSSILINFFVSFLVNFILFYAVANVFRLTEAKTDYIYIIIAFVFTIYEEIYKEFLIKNHVKLVLYSSGLIFFLMNLIFFYLMDLLVFVELFSFANYLYPIVFIVIFQFFRLIIKTTYIYLIHKINISSAKKS
ncbi:MAG: hypothetical protein JXB20_00815 [Bacilli bacterium]|nr:hypothetical protein [Bacilli bacterium]MBN2696664.1 hypothetical protein [Bacilli bacterium]